MDKSFYAMSPDYFLNEAFGKGSGYAILPWKSNIMALPLEDQTIYKQNHFITGECEKLCLKRGSRLAYRIMCFASLVITVDYVPDI